MSGLQRVFLPNFPRLSRSTLLFKTIHRDFEQLVRNAEVFTRRAAGAVTNEFHLSARFTFLDVKEPFGKLTAGELAAG